MVSFCVPSNGCVPSPVTLIFHISPDNFENSFWNKYIYFIHDFRDLNIPRLFRNVDEKQYGGILAINDDYPSHN